MLGNRAFRSSFRALGCLTVLVKTKVGQVRRQADPLIDKFSKPTVVVQLFLQLRPFLIADKTGRAFPVPRKAELIVRTVLDWRYGLASASRIAADVVLLGYHTGSQIAQRRNSLFDFLDSFFKRFGSVGHDVKILEYGMRNIQWEWTDSVR